MRERWGVREGGRQQGGEGSRRGVRRQAGHRDARARRAPALHFRPFANPAQPGHAATQNSRRRLCPSHTTLDPIMASTTLEVVRAQHEELERFEKGIMQQLNAASSGLDRAGRKLSKKRTSRVLRLGITTGGTRT